MIKVLPEILSFANLGWQDRWNGHGQVYVEVDVLGDIVTTTGCVGTVWLRPKDVPEFVAQLRMWADAIEKEVADVQDARVSKPEQAEG